MVVEKETGMPLYFRYMVENIVDVKTLLEAAENAVVYGKRMLYVKRVAVDLYENPAFAYVVCDVKRKADEITKYMIAAKEDSLSVDEINAELIFKGKLVIVSSVEIPANEIIPLYYTRQSAENLFGVSKSFFDILPLRVHSIETFGGYHVHINASFK